GSALLGCAIGIALAAVQLVPAFELAHHSIAAMRGEWSFSAGGLPLRALVSMVLPNHYDIFDLEKYRTRNFPWNPSFLYLYCGLAAVSLAPAALVFSRHKQRITILTLTMLSAFWMLGENTPVLRTLFPYVPKMIRGSVYSDFAMPAFLLGFCV